MERQHGCLAELDSVFGILLISVIAYSIALAMEIILFPIVILCFIFSKNSAAPGVFLKGANKIVKDYASGKK